MSAIIDRLPPQSPDAEVSVLGAIFIDPEAAGKAIEHLRPEDFYVEAHQQIYRTVLKLFEEGKPIDVVMVGEALRNQGIIEAVGGLAYLMEIAAMVPTSAHIEHYARMVREKSTLRGIISAASRTIADAYQGEESPREVLDRAQQALFQISQQGQQHVVPLHDVLVDTFTQLESLYQNKGKLVGVPTGYPDLDRITAGLQKSDLIILAARPSVGKTMFSLNLARHVAVYEKTPVVVFSLEMSREQLALRLLSAEAQIDGHRLRSGELDSEMWNRLSDALGRLAQAPIFIDDTPGISVLELRAKARQLRNRLGMGLVVVDYLQLMQGGRRVENRQQEISDISRSLKALARELNCPVLALSQLSRAVESRNDKRPMLSDLRESGAIEQDADIVTFLYREDYYSKEVEHPDVTELIVAKQRNGPTGTVKLLFQRDIGRFVSVAGHAE